MFTLKSLAAATALSLSLLASTPVHASSATASITNLQIRLVDLDLSDGVTPTLTPASYLQTWLQVAYQQMEVNSFGSALGPLTKVDSFGTSSAQVFGGDPFSSSGWAATASVNRTVNESSGIVGIYLPFTLTTNTLLLVSGNFSAQVSATPGDYTSAESRLEMRSDDDAVTTTNIVDSAIYPDGHFYSRGGNLLQASYANVTGRTVDGILSLQLRAYVDTAFTSTVPEPASIALMIGGLAFVAAFTRRKMQRHE